MPEWIEALGAVFWGVEPLWFALLAILMALWAMLLGWRAGRRVRALEAQIQGLRREQEGFETAVLALHGAIKAVAEDVIDQGQHQASVQRALDRLAEQHSELRLRTADEGLYLRAIELIRLGHGRHEVRRLCGLTQAEVDLLFSLHGASLAQDQPKAR
ncbi:DUF2802 domain-containing protein [Caldichromatium japonicum]|uniref:DUF2802 domain-containing protein n=1 Tax=Caldichromatium japonicum TaxID=2699430 RepID=A0A6G7VFT7_9GAMM|nr:DUF2802 domain-containing protein [Caldichromatium japonicum]QIK38909.1 DUF2802 domain-containing protein [Caldichromatium japonicum]